LALVRGAAAVLGIEAAVMTFEPHPRVYFAERANVLSRAPCALTIGNFDGVHRGHQALLARVRASASALGLEAAVMTFEPHPREFFAARGCRQRFSAEGAEQDDQVIGWLIAMIQ
jgi:FAD synthase